MFSQVYCGGRIMNKISILIAEDEALIRMDLKEMLEAAGYIVCGEANNGQKAVELAEKLKPDLAILDVKMPVMNGLDAAKVMHKLNIPVILLTAYSQQNIVNRAEKVAVYGYLVKPVTERDLLPAVQIAYGRWKEVQFLQNQLEDTKGKLEGQKLISHARAILAKEYNISEYDAHKMLQKAAMDDRLSLIEKAKQIIAKKSF